VRGFDRKVANSRPLEGDVYSLTFRLRPDIEKGLVIEATFEARPF